MRLDEADDSPARPKPAQRGGDRVALPCPAQVDHHQIRLGRLRLRVQHIRPLHDRHPWLGAQAVVQHAIARVDGGALRRPML